MISFQHKLERDRLFDGANVSQQSIDASEEALEKHNQHVLPVIWTSASISLCLSVLGFYALLPKTPYLPIFALLAGFATAILNGGFWTFMFRRTRDAQSQMGVTIAALLFVIGGAIAILPSTGTNLAGFIVDASNDVDQAAQVEAFAQAINDTNQIASQLTNLGNTLESHILLFDTRFDDEIKGRGLTGKPGEGHVSNALLEAKNLFANRRAALDSGLEKFAKLKSQLDSKFAAWQQAQRTGDYAKKGFDETRTEVASLIAQIAVISPKSVAGNIADQIALNINVPNGAKRFQVDAIGTIRAEISTIAQNIRTTANGFTEIKTPKKKVSSKITLAWDNALQFWPMTILAIGIDLIAPLLFLMKLPGFLTIHAQKRDLAARKGFIRNELAFHRAPRAADIVDLSLSDVEQTIHRWVRFQRIMVDIGVQGHENLPLDEDFYAGLKRGKDDEAQEDTHDDPDDEDDIEDYWKNEPARYQNGHDSGAAGDTP